MLHPSMLVLLTGGVCALNPAQLTDDAIRLTAVPKGGMAKVGYYSPKRASFSPDKPALVTKLPVGLAAAAQFGSLPIGNGEIAFIIDEPDGKPATLFVDSNRNGDLTDDPEAEWKGKESKVGDKTTTMYTGSAMVDIGEKDKPFMVNIAMYRFDKNDPARAEMKSVLLYYRDYAYEGMVKLGEKDYRAVLSDEAATGDFRGKPAGDEAESTTGVNLLLDINGNGKFDSRGESFDIGKPFNVGGMTWEVTGMARDGSSFRVVKSAKTVAEISTPPDHAKGKGHGQNARHDGQQRYNGDNRHYANRNCPPGLAKKNNGCMAPGQARKRYNNGQRWNDSYGTRWSYNQIPYNYRQQYNLDPNDRYYYRDGYIYRVDNRTRLVEQVLSAILR